MTDEPTYSPQPLSVSNRWVDGGLIVSVVGEIDATTVPLLRAAIRAGMSEAGNELVVVDLTEVGFLGSAGLAVLVGVVDEANRRNVRLRIVVDHTRAVVRPIEITGLDEVLPVYESVQQALHSPS